MAYTYILQSIEHGTYYVGSTELIIDETLHKHNNGWVDSTKSKRPWKIIHAEEYATLSEARKREKQIKSWKDRKAIERLIEKTNNLVSSSSLV